MTEGEAKTKLCPLSFSRQADFGTDGAMRRSGGPDCCIGSACMAWRYDFHPATAELRNKTRGPDDQLEPQGFCGLAGRP